MRYTSVVPPRDTLKCSERAERGTRRTSRFQGLEQRPENKRASFPLLFRRQLKQYPNYLHTEKCLGIVILVAAQHVGYTAWYSHVCICPAG